MGITIFLLFPSPIKGGGKMGEHKVIPQAVHHPAFGV
jgi:hypothetical protein